MCELDAYDAWFYILFPLDTCGEINNHVTCRYMGTITGTSDLDPVRWPNSYWRSVKVCAVNAVVFGQTHRTN